jgi:hypothetical protein
MVRRFYRKALDTFTYFLCRTKDPLLQQLGKDVVVSGDTRFDRVAAILDGILRLYFAVQKRYFNHCCREFLAKDEAFCWTL